MKPGTTSRESDSICVKSQSSKMETEQSWTLIPYKETLNPSCNMCMMLEFQSPNMELGLIILTMELCILIKDSACHVTKSDFLSDLSHHVWNLDLQA